MPEIKIQFNLGKSRERKQSEKSERRKSEKEEKLRERRPPAPHYIVSQLPCLVIPFKLFPTNSSAFQNPIPLLRHARGSPATLSRSWSETKTVKSTPTYTRYIGRHTISL